MSIGSRIKQRRLNLNYSLDDLSRLLATKGTPISKAALSKYELGKSTPKALNLFNICNVLDTTPEYFLKNNTFEINWIAFRKTSKFTVKEENRVKSIAKEQIEAQMFLDGFIDNSKKKITLPKYKISTLEDAETAAEKLRTEWKLNSWPIESITSLLEEKEIFVVDVDSEKGFDGLSGYADGKIPIIITIGKNTADRKRLNLSHELGHLVLDIKNLKEEDTAFRFAGAFLIPKDCLFNALGHKRRHIDIRELIILKEEYGISIQALIRRCRDLDIINQQEYKRLNIYMRANDLHLVEPANCNNKEIPTKIKSKLFRAIAEGLTTETEVLSRFPGLSREIRGDLMVYSFKDKADEMNRIMEESAKNILDEYIDGGSLSDFEIFDDVMEI
ncbi:MAG TPA: XRE family transcriptional regulator [Spirochaetota bacterium]|nr:XRE family transcriptional regulator [Spirochaetota bacterium]